MLRALFLLLRFRGVARLLWRLTLDRRVPLPLKMLLPAALVYFVVPWDFDFIPIVGRIDDLLVFILAAVLFMALAPREVVAEHLGGPGPQRAAPRRNDRSVIDGKYRIVDDD